MRLRSIDELIGEKDSGLIGQIDHVNYVVAEKNQKSFIDTWTKLGFKESAKIQTQKHNGVHVALTSGSGGLLPWGSMTTLSFSSDPDSHISKFLENNGEGIQYIAYSVHPEADMQELYTSLTSWGWKLMTDVLSYEDGNGAGLKVIAVAPGKAYGPFIKLIQRPRGNDGVIYTDFDVMLLDALYDRYIEYSENI